MAQFNIKEKIKGFGTGILGIIIFLGFCIIPFIFIFGALKVSEFLYPVISVLAGASIGLFLLIILPLSLFQKLRNFLAGLSLILSYIVGASVFMFSFLMIFHYLGWVALFCMFMFNIVSPIAAIGLFFKGQWAAGWSIVGGLIFTYGMRFYSVWLATVAERRAADQFVNQSNVIDIKGESEVIQNESELIEESPGNIEDDSEDEDAKFD